MKFYPGTLWKFAFQQLLYYSQSRYNGTMAQRHNSLKIEGGSERWREGGNGKMGEW
jgi:hypothetical protein